MRQKCLCSLKSTIANLFECTVCMTARNGGPNLRRRITGLTVLSATRRQLYHRSKHDTQLYHTYQVGWTIVPTRVYSCKNCIILRGKEGTHNCIIHSIQAQHCMVHNCIIQVGKGFKTPSHGKSPLRGGGGVPPLSVNFFPLGFLEPTVR